MTTKINGTIPVETITELKGICFADSNGLGNIGSYGEFEMYLETFEPSDEVRIIYNTIIDQLLRKHDHGTVHFMIVLNVILSCAHALERGESFMIAEVSL